MEITAPENVWIHDSALGSGDTISLKIGLANSGHDKLPTAGLTWLYYTIQTEKTANLLIDYAWQEAFSTVVTVITFPCLATVVHTPYDLPAPMGDSGRLPIMAPFLRFRLQDTAGANHTYTRFYARAWA